jgi:hypothetical protein
MGGEGWTDDAEDTTAVADPGCEDWAGGIAAGTTAAGDPGCEDWAGGVAGGTAVDGDAAGCGGAVGTGTTAAGGRTAGTADSGRVSGVAVSASGVVVKAPPPAHPGSRCLSFHGIRWTGPEDNG